jgi:hypothetical protein
MAAAPAAELATLFALMEKVPCISTPSSPRKTDLSTLTPLERYPFPLFVEEPAAGIDHRREGQRASTNLGNGVCFARRMPSLMAFNQVAPEKAGPPLSDIPLTRLSSTQLFSIIFLSAEKVDACQALLSRRFQFGFYAEARGAKISGVGNFFS